MYRQIIVLFVFGMLNLCVLNVALSEEKNSGNNDIKGDETEDMIEILERERVELDRLKSELQGAAKLAEDVKEVYKEEDLKKNSKVVLANVVKDKEENKEKPVDEQNSFPPSHEDGEVEELTTLEVEGDVVGAIEKIIKNGDQIIHSFEIAENLYKLGEYKTALELYKLIDKDKIDKEKKLWISYQIANCYRKSRLYDKAVKAYSEIQDVYEGTYWSRQAQWYIQDMEWRATAEEKVETVLER